MSGDMAIVSLCENGEQASWQKTRRERIRDQDRGKMQEEDEERLALREVSERKRNIQKEREKKKDERKRKNRRVEATR